MFPKSSVIPDGITLLRNIKAGQGQIRGLGDFDVPVRPHEDGNVVAVVLHQAGLVGAVITLRQGAIKGLAQNGVTKSLRRLGRTILSRGMVPVIVCRSTFLMVSTLGMPRIAAPFLRAVSTTWQINASSMKGRTASWTTTTSVSGGKRSPRVSSTPASFH